MYQHIEGKNIVKPILKLINNENKRLSVKTVCASTCYVSDYAFNCTSTDICTIDYSSCTAQAIDICGTDYSSCSNEAVDVCDNIDSPCSIKIDVI